MGDSPRSLLSHLCTVLYLRPIALVGTLQHLRHRSLYVDGDNKRYMQLIRLDE